MKIARLQGRAGFEPRPFVKNTWTELDINGQ
jgi:hypothetical protein